MADQKTDDTKSPLARRGARPFAGPGSAPSAARPFLRPATPSQRPTAAPFVPPIVPTRPALGTSEPLAVAPVPTVRPTPAAVPVAAPVAVSVPATPVTMAAPAAPPEPRVLPEPTPVVSAMPTPDSDPFFGNATATSDVETPAARSRPITTEMIALDAFDAFDTVWGTAERHDTAEHKASTSSLDETALGAALDAQHPWADDITANGEPAATSAPTPSESTHPTPGFAMPPWLADDHDAAPPAPQANMDVAPSVPQVADTSALHQEQAEEPVEAEVGHWPITAGDYDYSSGDWAAASAMIPAADEIGSPDVASDEPASLGTPSAPAAQPEIQPDPIEQAWAETVAAAVEPLATLPTPELIPAVEDRPRFELVDDRSIAVPYVDGVPDARLVHRLRISATLDRLAQRMRDGEIDVSSIAPEATDAAVLASVLAALLGGSSSR